jgi:hypothetical protein
MVKTPFILRKIEPRPCIQDPGFLEDPQALWALAMFLAFADRAAVAVESAQRYALIAMNKEKIRRLSEFSYPASNCRN